MTVIAMRSSGRRTTSSRRPTIAVNTSSLPSALKRTIGVNVGSMPGASSTPNRATAKLRSAARRRLSHPASTISTSTRAQGTDARHRRRSGRQVPVSQSPDFSRVIASENAAAVCQRSAGSFSRARNTASSTCGGTVLRSTRIDSGSSDIARLKTSCALTPVNGGSPVSIS